MSGFNARISAQTQILDLVNRVKWGVEQLFSLNEKAITRWVIENNIKKDAALVMLIRDASDKLFFLANKSQEQITEDYTKSSCELRYITHKIENELAKNYLVTS